YGINRNNTYVHSLRRYNARGVDLNRNFPDHFKTQTESEQPETTAVRRWIHQIPFVLSGNIHGGAVVASYPFDNSPNAVFHQYNKPSLTPDDDVFKQIASVYSFNHANMYLGAPCSSDRQSFPNGTTNGAAWYPLAGGRCAGFVAWSKFLTPWCSLRRHAGLQLRLGRLHGGDIRDLLLQVPAETRATPLLGRQQAV
ncbi:unnamed protein product, partial [Ixodes pacificus]